MLCVCVHVVMHIVNCIVCKVLRVCRKWNANMANATKLYHECSAFTPIYCEEEMVGEMGKE